MLKHSRKNRAAPNKAGRAWGTWCWWVFPFVAAFSGHAVQPFEPETGSSINELWRWTELEALAGLAPRGVDEDSQGNLWFAKHDEVVRYDGSRLQRFPLPLSDSIGSIRDIYASQSGDVYLLTSRSLLVLEQSIWRILVEIETQPLLVDSISETTAGDIWIGASSELVRISDGVVSRYPLALDNLGATAVDHNNRLWVAEAQSGRIAVFDLTAEGPSEFQNFELEPTDASIYRLLVGADGAVWAIGPDNQDRCAVFVDYRQRQGPGGLKSKGFNSRFASIALTVDDRFFAGAPRQIAEWQDGGPDVHTSDELPIPTTFPLLLGLANGHLLVSGRESKTYMVDLSFDRWQSYRGLNFQCEDAEGGQWFLHHDGRVIYRKAQGDSWLAFDQSDGVISTPNRVFISSDGVVWASGGHDGSAAVSFLGYGIWQRTTFPSAGSILSHIGVLEARDGAIIFGSGESRGLQNPSRGGAVVFRHQDLGYVGTHVPPPIFPQRPANIVERTSDGFWFGATSLMRRPEGGEPIPQKVPRFGDNWIDHLAIDDENNLWAAVWGRGVFRFDGHRWAQYNESNGLLSEQVIYIHPGEASSGVWVITTEGLERFDGHTWTDFEIAGGGPFLREQHTLRESSDGALWINYAYRDWLLEGAVDAKRASVFRSLKYRADQVAPQTVLDPHDETSPEGGQVAFSWRGRDPWSTSKERDLQYSWRINSGEWSPFSETTHVALSDLEAGEYRFEVRARDTDWNIEPEPVWAQFLVSLPLWKRTWFLLVCLGTLAIIAGLVGLLIKTRVRAAIALEEFKLDFFTNLSHELRNPLAVIVGPLESLVRRDSATEEERNLMQVALRNTRKMQGIVDQLLQFRSLGLGSARYFPIRGEIIGFIRDAVELHAPLWKAKEQLVNIITEPQYSECEFDAEKLQKIVDNLLGNAIKYAPCGGRIEVGVRVREIGQSVQCELWVQDNGTGIPSHQIELVTEPFYRIKPRADDQGGFGIGLALVRQLVNLWGGQMRITSPPEGMDTGTKVVVELPLCEPLADSSEEDESSFDSLTVESERRPGILIVEDNLDLRHFLKGELHQYYEIWEAANGQEALGVASRENPDLILTDIMMPVMDGIEFTRRARELPETSHIPIIILTAKNAEQQSIEGIKAGADAYFPKPLSMERLKARIQNLLDTRNKLKQRFSQELKIEPSELTVTSADELFLRKAIQVVEANMSEVGFDVNLFATEMAVSRTTLYRKLKAITDQGPNPFIRSMRLKRAAQLLSTGNVTVSEVLGHVGVYDHSYFSRIFKKEFGVPPTDYQAKHKSAEN